VTAPVPARDPAERALLQRERILRAARRCFVRHGFHAASMADIARTAEMSCGLIYRYFENKNAIVRAIIDRQMEEARDVLDQIGSSQDLVSAILAAFESWTQGEDEQMSAALLLEMVAVAARDEEIASAMQVADRVVRGRLREALMRSAGAPDGSECGAEVKCRATMLQCLIEGLLVRAIRQPDVDRAVLRSCLEEALVTLRPPHTGGGCA
jgi:AcrR family transcriptional regulator